MHAAVEPVGGALLLQLVPVSQRPPEELVQVSPVQVTAPAGAAVAIAADYDRTCHRCDDRCGQCQPRNERTRRGAGTRVSEMPFDTMPPDSASFHAPVMTLRHSRTELPLLTLPGMLWVST